MRNVSDETRHTCAMCWCHDAALIEEQTRARIVADLRREANQWSHATKVILLDLANRYERGDHPGAK
jgi:hypothetical protein